MEKDNNIHSYIKKPVVIQAFQMTKERSINNSEWPIWLDKAWNKDFKDVGAVSLEDFPDEEGKGRLIIRTLEGVMIVNFNDFIIQGVNGELYPCKPEIFEKTYDAVN